MSKICKVWIDAGHGGSDSGAVAGGLIEKAINLTVALELIRLLEEAGFLVGATRKTDVFVGLTERCNMANRWGAQLFLSIHHNAGGGDGYEAIHSIGHGLGDDFAAAIVAEFAALGQNPHGSHPVYSKEGQHGDYFAVIRQTHMPAVISEFAFLDSKDASAIDSQAEQMAEARALFNAICKVAQSS